MFAGLYSGECLINLLMHLKWLHIGYFTLCIARTNAMNV